MKTDKRLVIIANRFSQGQDLLEDNHLRANMFAKHFAKIGYDVTLILIDYKKFERKSVICSSFKKIVLPYNLSIFSQVNHFLENDRSCIVIVMNGPIIGSTIIFSPISYYYDIIDCYEAYYKFPYNFLLNLINRYLINRSKKCLVINSALISFYNIIHKYILVPNGFDSSLFKPMPQSESRLRLGLPYRKFLIGYFGSKDSRVLDNLRKIARLSIKKNFVLVTTGRGSIASNTISLGFLDKNELKYAISSVDIAIVPNRPDLFSKYSFPSKIIEYLACNKRVLSTPTQPVFEIEPSLCSTNFNMNDFILEALSHKNKYNSIKIASRYEWHRIIFDLDSKLN